VGGGNLREPSAVLNGLPASAFDLPSKKGPSALSRAHFPSALPSTFSLHSAAPSEATLYMFVLGGR
jgi:hypothetical protein